jgi:NAD(P)-dependent dehydrogenase (short-subunit alcohol dehydrogenase family)
MDSTLAGRTIAVTGATGGIGMATVDRLVDAGARVILLDLVPELVASTTERLAAAGHAVVGHAVDTADEAGMVAALADGTARLGPLDGLVTAAGIDHKQTNMMDVDLALWERVHRVNLTGTFVACRSAARHMIGRGGAIVTIGSVSAVTARMGKVPYCSSKAGVLHLTRAMALELAAHDIRVNAVCPGPTETQMVTEAIRNDGPEARERRIIGSLEQFRVGIPLRRMGTPDEQAAVIEFMLSPGSSFMTGTAMFVDGGVTVL